MKILQILDEPWDSGLTAYGLALARGLADRGHESAVAARPDGHAFRAAAASGLPVLPLTTPWALRRAARSGRFDVVNAHTGRGHFWGLWAAKGAALVRTYGDARPVKRSAGRAFVYRRTHAVIAASAFIAAQFRARYPDLEERLETVYPGTDVPPFAPPPAGPVRIALVGRLDPVKGQGVFLDAAARLEKSGANARFVIAGEEKGTPLRALQTAAERLGLSSRFEFLGRLPSVSEFMVSCHIGVVPSTGSEAVSRVCLEWMAAGRPVAASRVGCLPELVEDTVTGHLVPAGDAGALAVALGRLAADPEARDRMGRGARDEAARRFGADKFIADTVRAYDKALSRRHG
ncbi:MAG: glycosyltransferase family 4 protein [Elusimicrobiota bacterium]